MKNIVLLITVFILISISCTAQNNYNNNKTMVSIGGPLGFVNLKVEHDITIAKLDWLKWRPSTMLLIGAFYNSDQAPPSGLMVGNEIAVLTHPNGSGLDLSLGVGITVAQLGEDKHLNNGRLPTALPLLNLGYRKRLNQRYTLRAGVGFPYFLSIGLGF